jgi:hypothetical protein
MTATMGSDPLTCVSRAAIKTRVALCDRDKAIRDAHADGYSVRAIAEASGLSFQRVHQIVQSREPWITVSREK